MARAFKQVAPRAYGTLSWVWELQRIKVALQNILAQDPEAVRAGRIHVMHTKLDKYSSFVKFRKSMAIFYQFMGEVRSEIIPQVRRRVYESLG